MKCRRALLAAVLAGGFARRAAAEGAGAPEELAPPASARASVTWIFGDDDALHPPSEVRPASPAPSAGDRRGYDGLTTGLGSPFTGRENELLLGAAHSAQGFLPGVTTRAELALGLDLSALVARPSVVAVDDRGSALEVSVALSTRKAPPRLLLRLLPLNADRLRAGWLEVLSWGGEAGPERDSPYRAARTPPRGALLGVSAGVLTAEIGLKTATFLEPVPGGPAVEEASYGGYGALELRSGAVAAAAAVGRFEHGRLAGLRAPPRSVTMGASVRASLGSGLTTPRAPLGYGLGPVEHGLDDAGARSGWVAGLEAATLVQRLRLFDEPARTALSPARALALAGTLRAGIVEARAALVLRDAAFVMRGVPGAFEGLTLPAKAASQSDLLAVASGSARILPWLAPGLSLGVRSPAAVMTAGLDALGQPTGATTVLYGPGDVELLPPGEAPVPILELGSSLELGLSRLLTAVGFLGYRRDFNRARVERTPSGALARAFADPNRLLYGLAARAVW